MQNRTFAAVLAFLLCAVLSINIAIYKFGLRSAGDGKEVFSVLKDVSEFPLRDDSLDVGVSPSVSCNGHDIELVMCVPVKIDGWAKRDAIRQTWGSYGKYGGRSQTLNLPGKTPSSNAENMTKDGNEVKSGEIILLFFTGTAPSLKEQRKLEEEAKTYGDIFQDSSYIDTYENLTLKSISIIQWISKKCPSTRYVVKVDDDMYLNVPLLLSSLRDHSKTVYDSLLHTPNVPPTQKAPAFPPPFLVGFKYDGAKPIRDKNNKWYVPKDMYRDEMYPSYLSGTTYAMSGAAALKLYAVSRRLRIFSMEDIFITGLCAVVAGVPLVDDPRFYFDKIKADGCSFREMISAHRFTISQIRLIHRELNHPSLKCKGA